MGRKGDMLMGKRDGQHATGDTTEGQNATEGILCKSYSEVVKEGVRRRARVFVGDSIVRKTDRALNKGDNMMVCFPGAKIEAITVRSEKLRTRKDEDYTNYKEALNAGRGANVPQVYAVDASSAALWQENVHNPAKVIISAYLQGEESPIEPMKLEENRNLTEYNVCEECGGRVFTCLADWQAHLQGRSHRKTVRKRNREKRRQQEILVTQLDSHIKQLQLEQPEQQQQQLEQPEQQQLEQQQHQLEQQQQQQPEGTRVNEER
ncbi:hypothetical protein LSAT2_010189 [Lamellibrachia satsuma]|nr:hypothetical protein LSAT2_010189 [Lamellibrachia satsuma]